MLLHVGSHLSNANADQEVRRQFLICSRKDVRAEKAELGSILGLPELSRKERVHDSYTVAEGVNHWALLWTLGYLLDTRQM